MKHKYLELMKTAIDSYSYEYIEQLYRENQENGIKEHGISRITSVLGILISKGMKQDYYDLWIKLMDMCCNQMHMIKVGNDFAVREIMSCIIETKNIVPKEKTELWLSLLKKIYYKENYNVYAKSVDDTAHNIAVYNMAGEYLRQINGMCDTEEYFDIQIPCQLKRFDENGMYMDPGCPMLYDLATRVQFSLLLFLGYDGKYSKQVDDNLKKGAMMSLKMQSACFEIPYGGRSNQMVFNEAYQCACFEYEAARYKKEGNLELAGQFKRAAKLSYEAILRMVSTKPAKHVKNGFDWNSMFGCEWYAYYDVYMIALASFTYIAYIFSDDDIEEKPCPAETGGYLVNTSEHFHKVFANTAGYSIQIDTLADKGYDATGLGRIHKSGVSPEIALSCPFPRSPKYMIDDILMSKRPVQSEFNTLIRENPGFLSLCPAFKSEDNKIIALCDFYENLNSVLNAAKQQSDLIQFDITYTSPGFTGFTYIKEGYKLNEEGLSVCFTTDASETYKRMYLVPIIKTNKENDSAVKIDNDTVTVDYRQHKYTVSAKDCTVEIKEEYANRNGVYSKVEFLSKRDKIEINFSID